MSLLAKMINTHLPLSVPETDYDFGVPVSIEEGGSSNRGQHCEHLKEVDCALRGDLRKAGTEFPSSVYSGFIVLTLQVYRIHLPNNSSSLTFR